ncbi:hypothetical protein OCU04_010883 [Sclerotinia nivalis]|uniref:Alpha-xenorhabdolysin family binary toxin subunit A n=1 Tax=Sclerotinia nivalis TaxID=352851 RepID=A0A9X0AD13_9HELO|nr:hypothetical protein OCU04_010883 [Sclerotinia nivalis]
MNTAPPAYTVKISPSSWEEINQKLEDLIGNNRTLDAVINAAEQLSATEIEILVDGAEDHWPLETEEQIKEYSIGTGKTLSSEEGKARLAEEGNQATQVAREIERAFITLHLRVAEIDNIHRTRFTPDLLRLQQQYHENLRESRNLAVDISILARSKLNNLNLKRFIVSLIVCVDFDDMTIKMCGDDTISINTRKTTIGLFISNVSRFEESAHGIRNRYKNLSHDFSSLVTSFSDWAKDKEGRLTEQIEILQQELEALEKQLAMIQEKLEMYWSRLSDGIQMAANIAMSAPKGALFALIGGLIFATATLSSIAALYVLEMRVELQIHQKTRQKNDLKFQLETIRRARSELKDVSLVRFGTVIQGLSSSWDDLMKDAKIIQEWLEKGADASKRPEYMQMNLNQRVSKFSALAVYLENYARAIV